jgi:hypothetical protein
MVSKIRKEEKKDIINKSIPKMAMNNISIKMDTNNKNNTNKNQNKKEMKKLEQLSYKNNFRGCNDDVNQNQCYVNLLNNIYQSLN